MAHSLATLFDAIWLDYIKHCPSALPIHHLLAGEETIVNDHVAFRTFNAPEIGLDHLSAHFRALGYEAKGEYHFEQKKLFARHFEHADPTAPKVFISELLLQQCSEALQSIVTKMIAQLEPGAALKPNFLYSGASWSVTKAEYQALLAESEYAAWLAAFGYRANHFTVSVNHLEQYESLEAVNEKLVDAGFELNIAGGVIKGSPQVLLEQSSTLADEVEVTFSDGVLTVPSCFYEFARRYQQADGELYTGFVAASADKIFESTHVR